MTPVRPYPDAASHLADYVVRITLLLEQRDAGEALDDAARRIVEREHGSRAELPLIALRARAGLDFAARHILVAAAADGIDASFGAALRARIQGGAPRVEELLALLALSPDDEVAVLEALAPDAPLVAHGLVELSGDDTSALRYRTVTVDDRVAAYLRGERVADHRLHDVIALHAGGAAADGPAVAMLARAMATPGPIVVEGPARVGKLTAVATAARGRRTLVADVAVLAARPEPCAVLARVVREAMLLDAQLVLRLGAWRAERPATLERALIAAIEDGAIATVHDGEALSRALRGPRRIAVAMPAPDDQHRIWRAGLGEDVAVERACARYPLPPGDIELAAAAARATAQLAGRAITEDDVMVAARARLCHRLGQVADLVVTSLAWSDLVLRDDVADRIQELISSMRFRSQVMDRWGFAAKLPYGRALSALFSGAPGTGKTMVATLLGKELGLEVFRVDLSKIVSKYIGETEQNLARVFEEASRCNAIILFDEADALFARRTEVKSSNDRYANLEVNFLLQRLEAHDGIVILTTNAATAIDPAFLRRLRYRVEFPEPDEHERALLWRAMIPADAPLAADVDFEALGRQFELAGGHIKNAVVRAAFLAAGAGLPALTQDTLVCAATSEWTELGNLPTARMHGAASPPRPAVAPLRLAPCAPPADEARDIEEPVRARPAISPAAELAVHDVLAASTRPGETIEVGFRRKEHELGALFDQLGVVEADALHHRLASPRPDDALAALFGRMATERKTRLLAFLADARRREARRLRRLPSHRHAV